MNPFTRFPVRLTVPIFLLLLALMTEALTLNYNLQHADVEEEKKRIAQVTQEMAELQDNINYRLRKGDLEGVQSAISGKGSNTDIPIAILVDDADSVIGSTSLKLVGLPIRQALPDLDAELMREIRSTLTGRVSLTEDRRLIIATYPVTLGARAGEIRPHRVGILHLRYDLTSAKAVQRHDHERQALVMVGIYTGGFLLFALFLHLSLTGRVGRLVSATRRFADGDLSARTELKGEDELAQIGVEFDRMAGEIARSQEALSRAGSYNRSLIEVSLDPLVTIGPDGRITDVNAATESATGRTRQELIGTDFSDYFGDPERAREGYRLVFREGFVRDYPLNIRHSDGRTTPVLYNASVYRDEGGQVVGVFAAARDITELMGAEEKIQRLAAIVESTEDAIIGKTIDGIITSWNAGAERLYGYTSQEAIGRSIDFLTPQDRPDDILKILKRIGRGERIEHYETVRIRKDGSPVFIALTVSAIKSSDGSVIGASSIARDITERKRVEAEIARVNRALRMLSDSNQALIRSGDEASLLREVCRIAVAVGGYRKAWVGIVERDEAGSLRPTTQVGYGAGDTGYSGLQLPDVEHDRGPYGVALRTGSPCIIHDIRSDPSLAYLSEESMRLGYRSLIALPLAGEGKTFGSLIVYAAEPNAFELGEVDILKELAGDLAFGITALRSRVLRNRAEEELHRTASVLEHVFSSVHILLAYLDRDFNFLKVNRAYAAADKREPEFFVGKNHFALFPNVENEAIFRHVVENGESVYYSEKPFEYAEHPEWGVSYWDWALHPVKDINGRVDGLVFSLLNVTETVLARKHVEQAAAYTRSLIEASLDPLVTIGPDGRITDVNAATESATGRTRQELIGTDFSDYFGDPERAREGYQHVFREGFVRDYPLDIRHSDGRTTPVLYNASLYRDEGGQVVGVFAAARDITELKRAEERILKLNRIYAILSNVNQSIVRIHKKDELLSEACRIAVEYGRFRMAWIGMVNFQTNRVDVVAANGVSGDYLEKINIDLNDERRSSGPTGMAIKTGKHKVSNNIINDESMIPWRDNAIKYDYKSSAAFPLIVSGKAIGAFNIYSSETDFFHEEDIKLFDEMAKDISFALEFMESEIERKRTEEELRLSEAMLKKAQQIGHMGCWELNLPTNRLSWSEEIYQIFGIDPKQFGATYEAFIETIHPDDREFVNTAYMNSVKNDTPYDIVHRIIRKSDGVIRYVNEKCENLKDAEGKVFHSLGTVQDITDQYLAAMELDSLRHYLDNIINSMPSILVGIDQTGIVTHWNSEAARVSEISPQEAKGMPFEKLMSPFTIDPLTIKEAIEAKKTRLIRAMQVVIHGESRYCDVMIYPLIANFVRGTVIRIDDVTERIRIEEMMLQTEKMMSVGGLAAGMAHEINNPLSGILQSQQNIIRRLGPELSANIEAAKETGVDLTAVKGYLEKRGIYEFLEAIRSSAERAAIIVKNMLQFSRPQTGDRVPTDIAELVDRTISLISIDYDLKKKYDFRNIAIEREYAQDLPPVKCIPGEIQQVIINILRNAAYAIFHSPDKRERAIIAIRLGRSDSHLRIEIGDNGPGMDETTRRRVFEPFFTTKPTGEGTGLGLSVSYYIIVDEHGGSLRVESSPGTGATFIIELPL